MTSSNHHAAAKHACAETCTHAQTHTQTQTQTHAKTRAWMCVSHLHQGHDLGLGGELLQDLLAKGVMPHILTAVVHRNRKALGAAKEARARARERERERERESVCVCVCVRVRVCVCVFQ